MVTQNVPAKRFRVRWFAFVCLATAVLLAACDLEDDWDNDRILNPTLKGKWFKDFGGGYTDTYIITENTVSHPEGYPPYANAEIEYVYNFNSGKTAGGLIIKRTEGAFTAKPYLAVWFNDLNPRTSVRCGDAYTVANYSDDPSVATLEEAKAKFSPANAATYGGGSAHHGSPLSWESN